MNSAERIGIIQGIKTAWLGMGIMLLITITTSLINGNLNELINPKLIIESWKYIAYIVVLTCFCGYITGKKAAKSIIGDEAKNYIKSGMAFSVLSLVIFGSLSALPGAIESMIATNEFMPEIIMFIPGFTIVVVIFGLFPALLVGAYLGKSLNRRRFNM
ncbi:MAG: hypothetical protein JXQ87_11815 [Bacteroidia bacterium]